MSKAKENNFITNNSRETQKLAENFIKRLKKRDVIALYGNLGSGKTTFVQGLVKGLGIKRRIISPTFIIIRKYNLKSQIPKLKTTSQNLKSFYHVDLYRIDSLNDIKNLGIEEIVRGKNVVAIEWAEKMQSLLPKKRWDVKFEDLGGDRRKIIVNQKL